MKRQRFRQDYIAPKISRHRSDDFRPANLAARNDPETDFIITLASLARHFSSISYIKVWNELKIVYLTARLMFLLLLAELYSNIKSKFWHWYYISRESFVSWGMRPHPAPYKLSSTCWFWVKLPETNNSCWNVEYPEDWGESNQNLFCAAAFASCKSAVRSCTDWRCQQYWRGLRNASYQTRITKPFGGCSLSNRRSRRVQLFQIDQWVIFALTESGNAISFLVKILAAGC